MDQTYDDFLVEIGTEELPPKSLYLLASCLADKISQELTDAFLPYEQIQFFATPRRLAVWVRNLKPNQEDRCLERVGPAVSIAYDPQGNPTPAAIGFAKSCQVTLDKIEIKNTPKGDCLFYNQLQPGETIFELAPYLVKKALQELPISKPMLWGNHSTAFVRPVHWLLMMYGSQVIPCRLFDLDTDNKTYGHRFHHPEPITVNDPAQFEATLKEKGFVIANFEQRKEDIREKIIAIAKEKGRVIIDESLLDEVTGLVEWPVPFLGRFDSRFLKVPQEALISAMKLHQKCFPLVNDQGLLLPYFIATANIESKEPEEVVTGNERVIKARLSDAEFFYHSDLKQGIEANLTKLNTIVFQNKLGTLYEKAIRISKLSGFIAEKINADKQKALRAGLLCKADLTTEMVGEFPELQGIMGFYYALENKESEEVATAIKEHYHPKFSGDSVPTLPLSSAVALADKLDTLVGVFGIKQAPTGEKDPFALRRAALGVLRILIENELALDLRDLLQEAAKGYHSLENANVVEETLIFMLERLRSWYFEKGISADIFASVNARFPTSPLDFDARIRAIQYFQQLPSAQALSAANKRVSNILKQTIFPPHTHYNFALFELTAEKNLATVIEQVAKKVEEFCRHYDYQAALGLLADLRGPIDHFFDEVMVMVDDEKLRNNRLLLLANLRQLFLHIADISLLQN
ncbi:MAG: glycine--tRNA ligase subunit beta [Gammaproteobacteria bacterium]|nr:glycine--tRNA ligase subunit beta [Gammaproteobacteria bacterium]